MHPITLRRDQDQKRLQHYVSIVLKQISREAAVDAVRMEVGVAH